MRAAAAAPAPSWRWSESSTCRSSNSRSIGGTHCISRGGDGWARAAILAALPGEPGRAPKCRAAGPGAPMTRKRRRLVTVLAGLLALGAATALVLAAFNDNLVFFYSPTDLAAKNVAPERRIRIGGLVETDSVKKQIDGHAVAFRVTDGQTELRVVYDGILPDLFREGQGVVAEGKMGRDGVFVASNVLAKHDEKYMPPEVAEALKKSGRWQEGGTSSGKPAALPAKAP